MSRKGFVAAFLGFIFLTGAASVVSSLTSFAFNGLSNKNGSPTTTFTNGDYFRFDGSGSRGAGRTTDAVPSNAHFDGQSAWSQATSHTAGGAVNVGGGLGRRKIALTAANCSTDTVTLTFDGSASVLTEGTDWSASSTNALAATSLAAAINALNKGVLATASSANVFIDKQFVNAVEATPPTALTMATSDGTCAALTSGTDGTYAEWSPATFKSTLVSVGTINGPFGASIALTTPIAPTAAQSGSLFSTASTSDAATVYTLPLAATAGLTYCFVQSASSLGSNREVDVEPTGASDLIIGTTTPAGGTGIVTTAGSGHGIKNTHATAVRGNEVCLQSDGANTYYMRSLSGIWAGY